jgi:hypothetical protein
MGASEDRWLVSDPDVRAIVDACEFVYISGHDHLEPLDMMEATDLLRNTPWHTKSTYDLAQWWYAFQAYSPLNLTDVWRCMGPSLLARAPPPIVGVSWAKDWRYQKVFPHLIEAYLLSRDAPPSFSDWWHHMKPPVIRSKLGLKLYICHFDSRQCPFETCCSRHPELLDAIQQGSPPELLHLCMMFAQCFDDSHSAETVTHVLRIFQSQLQYVVDVYIAKLIHAVPVRDLCRLIAHYTL